MLGNHDWWYNGDRVGRAFADAGIPVLENQAVHRLEHAWQFQPNRGELVDVEEAPVVDFLRSHAPVTQTINLRVEQSVEGIEAARVANAAFHVAHRLIDRFARPTARRTALRSASLGSSPPTT